MLVSFAGSIPDITNLLLSSLKFLDWFFVLPQQFFRQTLHNNIYACMDHNASLLELHEASLGDET